jgi:hypothetical protein
MNPKRTSHLGSVGRNAAVLAAEQAVVEAAIAWADATPDRSATVALFIAVSKLKELRRNA